jgi:cytochrome b561
MNKHFSDYKRNNIIEKGRYMSQRKAIKYYPARSRLLHWSMAVLIVCMLLVGLSMVESLAVWQPTAMSLHKSFGILLLVLVLVRVVNKYLTPRPKLPKRMSDLQKRVAKVSHFVLYLAMILMPVSGWLMQSADARPVSVFGLFTLPQVIEQNIKAFAFFREFHALTAWVLVATITLHVLGALYHGLVRQDRVLASMLYNKKPKSSL